MKKVFCFILAFNLNAGILKDAIRLENLANSSKVNIRDIKFYKSIYQEASYFFDEVIGKYKFQIKVRFEVKPFSDNMAIINTTITRTVTLDNKIMSQTSTVRNFSFETNNDRSDEGLVIIINKLNDLLSVENNQIQLQFKN